MLAYVFWHWPRSAVRSEAYEQLQRDFQRALAQTAPPGFRGSVVFRLDGQAAWLGDAPAYADWYLFDSSAALDPLNVAAVSGFCEEPHARVAGAALAGAGSLFGLRSGTAELAAARSAAWFAKPSGMPYETFYNAVQSVPGIDGASVWRRQMVLGPTPEFGILSSAPVPLPERFQPSLLGLTPIWTGS
jgi:hypothetical protein